MQTFSGCFISTYRCL